jgi:hypothetical protein
MVDSQTFNWNIFALEEGVVESRVPSRKQPIVAAQPTEDSTRLSRLPAENLNYMTAYNSPVN